MPKSDGWAIVGVITSLLAAFVLVYILVPAIREWGNSPVTQTITCGRCLSGGNKWLR
jgi:hypothetical protein